MIPQKLQLYNFLSYGQATESLDFRGLELACLVGANGVGKSSILEAITWALWGKSRAPSDDDLIHHGHQQMWVDFEFKLGRSLYRVTRKRSQKGRGQSSLDFMVSNGTATTKSTRPGSRAKQAKKEQTALPSKWCSLAGTTKNETQAVIIDALKMSYDTFVNSAFLRQGKADEFTLKKPQERKKVLADILNLAYYDQLASQAKTKSKEFAIQAEGLRQQLEFGQEEIREKQVLATETKKAKTVLQKSNAQIKKLEQELAKLTTQKEGWEKDLTKAQNLDDRLILYQKDIAQLEQDYQEQAESLRQEQKFLTREPEINSRYQELVASRQQDEELNKILAKKNELLSQQALLEQKVSVHKNEKDLVFGQLTEKINLLTTQVEQNSEITQQSRKLRQQIKYLQQKEIVLRRLESEILTFKDKFGRNKLLLQQITEQGQKIKEKIEILQTTRQADCPLCAQKLTADHRQKIVANLNKERSRAVADYKNTQAKISQQQSDLQKLIGQQQALQKELSDKAKLEAELLSLESKLKEISQIEAEIKSLEAKKRFLEQRERKDATSDQQRQQLAKIKEELSQLKHQPAARQKIKEKIKQLAEYEQQKIKLEKVQENIARCSVNQAKIKKALTQKGKEQRQIEMERTKLTVNQKGVVKMRGLIKEKQQELAKQRSDSATVQVQAGALQEKYNRLKSLAQAVKKQKAEMRHLEKEKSQYEELAVAFGKRGVQAMIIETAIPEIEEEANQLLNKMTDGRMRVRFLTQRQKKSSDEVMETLDIIINDEVGVKNYEMFSGGEAYRINFAIRIALSKLLANRAGAKLQFLVIDEGFGTQDTAGRESLIEAINSISDDFAKILVITHIQELKDAFSTRIEVIKDRSGSHFEIME